MKVTNFKPYLLFTKCKTLIFVHLVKPSIISFVWELRMVHLFLSLKTSSKLSFNIDQQFEF